MRTPYLRDASLVTPALLASLLGGCFFPSYTFDEDGTGGSTTTTSTTTTTTSSVGGGTTTTTTTGSGGAGGGGGSTTTGTGGTGGSTTVGTGGAGGMGTGGSGGGGPTEDCTNGVDDDLDLDIDCADAECTAIVSCVAPAPAGWTGFFTVYEGPAANFMGCPAEYPTEAFTGNSGLVAAQATCSTCTCGTPTGRTCDLADSIQTGDAQCGMATFCSADFTVSMAWNGTCEGMTQLPGGQTTCGMNANMTCSSSTGVACNQSVSMGPATITGGSCTPSTVVPTKGTPTWDTLGVACGDPSMTAEGCNGQFSCLPKPDAGFLTGACVMKSGVNACPAGVFTKQHVFYTGFTDSRGCSACGCDAPAGGTCGASVQVFSDSLQNQCTVGPIATMAVTNAAGACANIAGNPTVSNHKATITAPTGGSCPATGGAPIGAALPDPATATTFCCL